MFATSASAMKSSSSLSASIALPLKSVLRKKSEASSRGFCLNPAPGTPLDKKDKCEREASKTPKCLRFDMTPSFYGGSASPSFFQGNAPNPSFGHIVEKEDATPDKLQASVSTPEGDSMSYTVTMSVKNTFVHFDRSPVEDEESDVEFPCRSVSAPSMSTFSSAASPANGQMPIVDSPVVGTPFSVGEPAYSFFNEPLEGVLASIATEGPQLPTAFGLPALPCQASGSSTGSSSSPLDTSCTSFKVKNTFIHIDVDRSMDDDEDVNFGLPIKSVSQPDLSFQKGARLLSAPATPHNMPQRELVGDDRNTSGVGVQQDRTLPSVGAALHVSGECKPCAWFWKPESCQWGAECRHCHLCPMGELRRRKKDRQAEAKELKRAAAAAALLQTEQQMFSRDLV